MIAVTRRRTRELVSAGLNRAALTHTAGACPASATQRARPRIARGAQTYSRYPFCFSVSIGCVFKSNSSAAFSTRVWFFDAAFSNISSQNFTSG